MTPIVFDLDGTLVESAPDLHIAAIKLLAEEGRAPLDLDIIRSFIGNGVPKLVERVIKTTRLDMARHAELTERFMGHYMAAPAELTRAFDGVEETLRRLAEAGHLIGICTNKPEAPTVAILKSLGLEKWITAVVGGDSLTVRKPDPAPLRRAFQMLGGTGIYVGDSEVDAETAIRAEVPFVLFTEGYRATPLAGLPHLARFSDFAALPAIIRDLKEPAA